MPARRRLRWVLSIGLLLAATPIALVSFGRWRAGAPSATRTWAADHAASPRVDIRGDSAIIYGFRRFRHDTGGRFSAHWDTASFDLSKLHRVWFALAPFGREWMGTAHSFVSFGFRDSQFVSISVEARREIGEVFGMWAGLTRQLELLYVIGDENDVIRQRVVGYNYDVYLYPIATTADRARALFVSMLKSADGLRENPQHYDLLTNNCTSVLIDHVNTIVPGRIPRGLATLLPGYSDRVAVKANLVAADGDRDALRARFRINDVVRSLADDGAFSRALHQAMAAKD